ncbi:hypothetical protein MG290_01700 [Flavobacterium sp. CBA20B-1]|uniref:hypothetical protein n=1 Tax=unclassified Flavobacterium TaxID=196869 RepID=UPI00222463C8|nr:MULTISPECIES: hypothetical protein [unclassified Flavobacterium]WCM42410.1 hypothetical protein MG290_01700 [Flavobacterium sp. CBA20B-1]
MEDNFLEIGISLSENVSLENNFAIYLKDNIGANYNVIGTFTNQRTGRYQIELGQTKQQTIQNLNNAFKADYGNEFNISFDGSLVSMKSKLPGWEFVDSIKIPIGLPLDLNPQLIPVSGFNISSVEFYTAENSPCSKVMVKVTANQPIAQASINHGAWIPINGPVYEFEWYRGFALNLRLTDYIGTQISRNITTPPLIETVNDSIKVVVNKGDNSSTATVIHPYTDMLIYEFSLDNENWQTSNTFAGLLEGEYSLYVKDNLGCSKIIPFSILGENFGEPVVFISKENSIRFVEPSGAYETDENRTFCKSAAKLNYGYIQEFLNTDIITTQFRSNYNDVNVSLFNKTDDNNDFVFVSKLTNNIGLKAKYNQVKKYQISPTQFGIYFETGQILDYDTNAVFDTYNLNGSLPIWAVLGNVIDINGTFYAVDSIGYDENVNAEVLIFNGTSSPNTQDVIVSCVYNIQDYEVYEFTIDMQHYLGKEIMIEIRNQDPNFGTHIWKSETISVVESLEKYLEIRYFNSTNTNVIYSSGIQHLLRIPYNTIKAVDSDSNESYKTDTNTELLKSDVYEITDFEFIPLPLEMYRKVKLALSMDSVFIDGVGYTKNAEFQKENLGSTNLYKLTASMIKNGFVFNSNSNNSQIITDVTINVPGLIENTIDGYIGL